MGGPIFLFAYLLKYQLPPFEFSTNFSFSSLCVQYILTAHYGRPKLCCMYQIYSRNFFIWGEPIFLFAYLLKYQFSPFEFSTKFSFSSLCVQHFLTAHYGRQKLCVLHVSNIFKEFFYVGGPIFLFAYLLKYQLPPFEFSTNFSFSSLCVQYILTAHYGRPKLCCMYQIYSRNFFMWGEPIFLFAYLLKY